MDEVWKSVKSLDFSRKIELKTYKQNTPCKREKFMLIIALQEDSMSGSYVYHVRRDVLSKNQFSILNASFKDVKDSNRSIQEVSRDLFESNFPKNNK